MSSDHSRNSFDSLRNFASVLMQQGRAVLDSDWNEMAAILVRRIRAGTVDTIGRAVVPLETRHGFEIRRDAAGLQYGRGRFYLDGLLCENFGDADFAGDDSTLEPPAFDRARANDDGPEGVLDERISPEAGDFTPFARQPYWPTPQDLPDGGPHLVYLVAWQREVTPTEWPELLEPALGGLDTTTRLQTVWQVRILANAGDSVRCATPDPEVPGWEAAIAPSTARLTTGMVDIDDPEDPCLVPPTEGYTGVENQFYRVELHAAGVDANGNPTGAEQGDWRFKFSRENASVRASVTAVAADGLSLTVGRIGRDAVLRFAEGDWVELTDDRREFNHRSGQMLRIASVDQETREIEFESAVAADLVPGGGDDTLAARHTRLVRWDQRGVIRLADESEWVDLDAAGSDGLVPVPPDGRAILLESGITVSFATAEGRGRFHEMDYWRFAARTAGTQVEILNAAPPDGIQRHYARLAVIAADGEVEDCRTLWPPSFAESEGCACTVCVTADSHNSGALTIQDAVDRIGPDGGTICLAGGSYMLREGVRIEGRNAIRVVGQGLSTVLMHSGSGGAIQVENAIDVELEQFTILAVNAGQSDSPTHGITAVNTGLLAARRLAVLVAAPGADENLDFALALDGLQLGTVVEECVLIGSHAVGSRSSYGRDEDGDLQFAAFAELRVTDCILYANRNAVRIDRAAMNLSAAELERNLVLTQGIGIRIDWAEIPAASLSIAASSVLANQTGIMAAAGTLRIQDCTISGGAENGDGIFLAPNLLPGAAHDVQVVGNTISDLAGAGIRMGGEHGTVFIKRNIIRDCGLAGILTDEDSSAAHVAVDNNSISDIGLSGGGDFAVGIVIADAQTVTIAGNRVSDVGEAGMGNRTHAGIVAQNCGAIDICGNIIGGAAGLEPGSRSFGILALMPFISLKITGNTVIGEIDRSDEPMSWQGIRIGMLGDVPMRRGGLGASPRGYMTGVPGRAGGSGAYVEHDDYYYAASRVGARASFPAMPAQISCRGNQLRSRRSLSEPMVWVYGAGARALGFSDNQCDVEAPGEGPPIVLLAAPVMSVNANSVVHNSESGSMELHTSRGREAAVLGNVTTGTILLNGSPLPAPFDALNLRI